MSSIKLLFDDDSKVWHSFGAKASLPLTQGALSVSYNTTTFC